MNRTEAGVPHFLFLLVFLSLLAMFAASFRAVMENSASRIPERDSAIMDSSKVLATPPGIADLPDGGADLALTEKQADDLTGLMRKLQADPNDAETLIAIGDTFLMTREWPRAEVFLHRAILSRPGDVRPRYMLGVCLYQQGKIQEARLAYEELLTIREDPPALYNLALIYKYHLNDTDKARSLLEKVIGSPDADMDTLDRAKKEL
jgi:Flp pilus assembly protein TadD